MPSHNDADDADDEKDDASAGLIWKGKDSCGVIPTPIEDVSFLSKYITLWWMNNLLSLGTKRPLEASDLYGLMKQDQSNTLCEKLEREWEKEVVTSRNSDKSKKPSLIRALVKAFGKGYASLGILAFFADGLQILQPVLLGQLIHYFTEGSSMPSRDAYLYAAGLGLCGLFITIFNTPLFYMRNIYGMRVRVACTSLIYNKTLQLSNAALASTTTGYIVNLVSSDTQTFDWSAPFFHYLVLAPIEVVVVLILLWYQIGIAALAGMGLLICLTPMTIKVGSWHMGMRTKALVWMDERVKIMNEVIAGMRVIKMYTWEIPFADWIKKLRKNELKWLLESYLPLGGFTSFFFSSLALTCFLTFLTYVLSGEVLTASKVFTCVVLFNAVRVVMAKNFPIAITMLNECKVSLIRMEELLLLDEMHSKGLVTSQLRPKPQDCGVKAEHVTAKWNQNITNPTLDDVSFDVNAGELLGVIGPVGSGKSSLLMSILGELPMTSGTISVKGKIAYASQQAWIYNSSLRHNIIFGKEYEEERYNRVIKVCALERDIELFTEGDLTLVGERGVSLSGGQRARIGLARALYSDADIYLLDDPLSAVDANVGRHLFDKCICGYLTDKPRILVTHQLQFLKQAKKILILTEGKCVAQDTYQNLSTTGVDFITLMKEVEEKEEKTASEHEEHDSRGHRFTRQISRQKSELGGVSIGSSSSVMSAAAAAVVYEEDLLPEEEKQEGAVSFKTYLLYLRSFHNLGLGIFVVFLFAVCQVIAMLCDLWLAEWVNTEESYHVTKQAWNSSSNMSIPTRPVRDYYLGVYGALVFGLLILSTVCVELYYTMAVVASKNLHSKMLASTMTATMYFFDNNSIGRILNRFAKDISILDDNIPWLLCDVIQAGFTCLGILFLVGATNPVTLVVVFPVLVIFVLVRNYFIKSSREVKRIEGISRSPLFGHFSTTLLGLDTIRAFGVQETFKDQFLSFQDAHSRAWFAYISGQAWLSFRLQILCVTFLIFVALISPVLKDVVGLSAGIVGLTVTYAIMLTSSFQPFIEQGVEVENVMTSVERIEEYCHLEHEGPHETDVKPPDNWPDKGQIEFNNMTFSYHKELPNVLHHISCVIKPFEKVGVVGRTGAGKSSLLSTLFRLAEPKGVIKIDDMNIRALGLRDLRRKLSIIPQDPVLFSGTMRKNLDPFNDYSDIELWNVLEEVQVKKAVEDLPNKLDEELAEAGSNFSVGQRQLVCLARAILKHNRILIIDEATANVDPNTDTLIQSTIREKFRQFRVDYSSSVLTIAHRLHTIMDSDRVMVLDAGHLKEFDSPYLLLENHKSIFSELVDNTGLTEARRLRDIAKKAYMENNALPENVYETDELDSKIVKREDDVVVRIPKSESKSKSGTQFETSI